MDLLVVQKLSKSLHNYTTHYLQQVVSFVANHRAMFMIQQQEHQQTYPKGSQSHPTRGLMQILHFDWLRYQGSNSNSHQVAKFCNNSKYFCNLHLLFLLLPIIEASRTEKAVPFLSDQLGDTNTVIPASRTEKAVPFLSDQLGDTKTIRPFAFKGHGSIAPAKGLIVNYQDLDYSGYHKTESNVRLVLTSA